jgi:penicillin-binding protein 1A/penicillin-binding protein 2A
LFGALLTISLFFGGLNVYFHTSFPIRQKVQTAAAAMFREHHVHIVPYAEIPHFYKEAVIATEDRRFSWDPGIDPIGILRSFVVDVEKDGYVEGGSTITQQLVDNTIIRHQKTLGYKIRQALYAIGLYDTMSKPETFDLYANVIYFGNGAYGLYNAAETYFGRRPDACNLGELAMLAGLPNAPSDYDPFYAYPLARKRESIVLENMVDAGMMTVRESHVIFNMPIQLRGHA